MVLPGRELREGFMLAKAGGPAGSCLKLVHWITPIEAGVEAPDNADQRPSRSLSLFFRLFFMFVCFGFGLHTSFLRTFFSWLRAQGLLLVGFQGKLELLRIKPGLAACNPLYYLFSFKK